MSAGWKLGRSQPCRSKPRSGTSGSNGCAATSSPPSAPRLILGLNDGHEASAALLADGEIVAACAEERLTRRKHATGTPVHAIEFCLRQAGVGPDDVDLIAVATRDIPPWRQLLQPEARFSVEAWWREQREIRHPWLTEGRKVRHRAVFGDLFRDADSGYDLTLLADDDDVAGMRAARRKQISDRLGVPAERVRFFDHHACHAHHAFFADGQREAGTLVLTAGREADGCDASIWLSRADGRLDPLARLSTCTLGRTYGETTLLLGMKPAEHEYKVMGLAPYGEPAAGAEARAVFARSLVVDGTGFVAGAEGGFFALRDRLEYLRFDAVARGLQEFTEDRLARWVGNVRSATAARHVRLAGGLAYNVKANQVCSALSGLDSFAVPAGAGDEGLSIGAAFLAAAEAGMVPRPAVPYLGPDEAASSSADLIRAVAAREGYAVREAGTGEIARLLADGEIVARLAGRSEFGPRALGNRSILADPRRPEVVGQLNACIKHRDFWMPFAPSIAREAAGDLLVLPAARVEAGLMTCSFQTTAAGRIALASAIHPADGSCRAQLVERRVNPAYHALLVEMGRQTGIAALLNTSFNLHGEPIVQTTADALRVFALSELRHLAVESILVSK